MRLLDVVGERVYVLQRLMILKLAALNLSRLVLELIWRLARSDAHLDGRLLAHEAIERGWHICIASRDVFAGLLVD